MIKSFKHKGLKKYFETGGTSGIQFKHARKLRMQLAAIDTAQVIEDVNLPGFKLDGLAKKIRWLSKNFVPQGVVVVQG